MEHTSPAIDPIAFAAQIRRDRGLALMLEGTAVLATIDAGQALHAAGAANTTEIQLAILNVAAKLMHKDDTDPELTISTHPTPTQPTRALPAKAGGHTCPICNEPIGPPPAVACRKHWRQVRHQAASRSDT